MLSLSGVQIKKVRKMSAQEMDDEGWSGSPPSVLVLSNGMLLYPSRDGEGNGPGAFFITTGDGNTLVF